MYCMATIFTIEERCRGKLISYLYHVAMHICTQLHNNSYGIYHHNNIVLTDIYLGLNIVSYDDYLFMISLQ